MNRIFKSHFKHISKSETAQAIAALFSSNMITSVVGIISTLLQGRFVSPEDLGYFRQFGIISGYVFFLHLGIFHAIEKMYPFYVGEGNKNKAIKVVEIGHSWMTIVCLPIGVLFTILSAYSFFQGNWKSGLGWLSQTIAVYVTLYGGFLSATYRSGHDFKKMAKSQLYGPLISLLFIPTYWIQSYIALFLKNTSQIVSLWKLYQLRPLKVKWRFNWQEWRYIVAQGLPRFTASYITTTGLIALRATIILKSLGTKQLGYWSFAWAIITIGMQLPQAITAVFIPKIIESYGKTRSVSKAVKLSWKPVVSGSIALCIALPIVILGTLKVMPVILPMYSETAGIIVILLLSLPFRLIEAPAIILNAMNKIGWINISAIINSIFQLLFIYIGLKLGWGLYGVAIGFFVGNLVRSVIIIILLIYEKNKELT